jgi:hypothetical protein
MKMTTRFFRALAIPGALAALTLTGCDLDDILRVQPANLIPAVDLEKPESAALLVAGVAADFDCAFQSYVVVGALLGEEFEDGLQTADRWPYDQRNISASQVRYSRNSCTALGIYAPLNGARVSANNVRRLLEGWTDVQVPNVRQNHIARVAAYEAWSQLLLAESFCEVVFSTVNAEVINYGTRLTRNAALDTAIVRFTQAIDVATTIGVGNASADSIRRFALVGRARAYQNRGNLAAARTDASNVPAGFVWNVTASNSNTRRQNRVFQESNTTTTPSSSVGARYRQPAYTSDPRVQVVNRNLLSNGTNVPLWAQTKYTTVASSIPAATYTEMQLLIAEADIATFPVGQTLAIINTSRAAGNQGAYTGATDATSLRNEIIDQRRRALFLTGTHFGDIIRYDLQISPAAGATTPWNQTFGPDRGSQLCLVLPDVEIQNNPNLH